MTHIIASLDLMSKILSFADIAESKLEEGRLENGLFQKQDFFWVPTKEGCTEQNSLPLGSRLFYLLRDSYATRSEFLKQLHV